MNTETNESPKQTDTEQLSNSGLTMEQFGPLLVDFQRHYYQFNPIRDELEFRLWYSALSEYDPKTIDAAFRYMYINEKYPPTIADVASKCEEIQPRPKKVGTGIPDGYELWFIYRQDPSTGQIREVNEGLFLKGASEGYVVNYFRIYQTDGARYFAMKKRLETA